MKKVIILAAIISLTACKKKDEVKPVETVTVEVYNTKSNSTLKVFQAQQVVTSTNYSNTYNVSEEDLKFTITLKNNVQSASDSIHLKVTYKGTVQQKGLKCNNTIGTISFNL